MSTIFGFPFLTHHTFLSYYIFYLIILLFLLDKIRQLINDPSHIHGYALTTFGDYIYASFSQRNKIIRANKATGDNIIIFRSNKNARRGPSDVFAYDKSRQPPGGACENAKCEQLCLPTGETTYRYYIFGFLLFKGELNPKIKFVLFERTCT